MSEGAPRATGVGVRRAKKILVRIAVGMGALAVVLAIAYVLVDEPRPEGVGGEDAEALALRLETAVDVVAWGRTRALAWTHAGRNTYLWDRDRAVVRVRWDDLDVLIHEGGASGLAHRAGEELQGDEAREALEGAYARFINDSFWLNPLAKMRDPGVTLGLVDLGRRQHGLLVSYASGGLTPGDAYLWIPGERDLPRAWRMWVSILPIGGVETSWEGWITLETGARVSTRHVMPFGIVLELSDVRGAESVGALVPGEDPFANLFVRRGFSSPSPRWE